MKCTIEINMDSTAFADNGALELGRIMERLGEQLVVFPAMAESDTRITLFDTAGVRVGKFTVDEEV